MDPISQNAEGSVRINCYAENRVIVLFDLQIE